MKFRILLATVMASLLAAASLAVAQAPLPGEFSTADLPHSDVTFHVPLNLTQLAADIAKVAVICIVFDPAGPSNSPRLDQSWADKHPNLVGDPLMAAFQTNLISGGGFGVWGAEKVEIPVENVEIPVASGAVITTATVIVTVSDTQNWSQTDHIGDGLGYACAVEGFSFRMQRWEMFDQTHAIAAFRLSPTPEPISDAFTW